LARHLTEDHQTASISNAEMAMLDHAVKLTREPWNMTREDIEKLRKSGWSDGAILDLTQISGYYAFVNRMADGLGVDLEPRWAKRDE
jgi:uncharacterized peroxidase-related enzyme